MNEVVLGKITCARFGSDSGKGFLFGPRFDFSLGDGGEISDVDMLINITHRNEQRVNEALAVVCRELDEILKNAKVCTIDELAGVPVEVTIENGMFKSFRILTEVL